MRLAAAIAALAAAACAFAPAPVGAQDDGQAGDAVGDPVACLDRAEAAFREGGARLVERGSYDFVPTGERRVVDLPGAGCVGLLALGPGPDVDVDATLYTASGILLSQDDDLRGWAYVEHCSSGPALERRVVLTVAAGQGPLRWLRFEGGPSKTDLNRAVGDCFAGGAGVGIPPPDLGPEPRSTTSPAGAGDVALADLRARGFRREGAPEVLTLGPRGEQALPRTLAPGRCYAFTAVGGAGVEDLDLYLRAADGRTVAEDESRARDATLETCPDTAGTYALVVRLYDGQGEARVESWVAAAEPSAAPPDLQGRARVDHALARRTLASRGFGARPGGWAHLRPGEAVPIPVAVQAGRCYAVTAVFAEAARPPRGVRVGLRWTDRDGRMLGEDSRVGEPPVLFHCPDAPGPTQVTPVVFGAEGRVLLLVGESGGPSNEDDEP